eukprot:INCI675.1.p1 GENE.INCI675.1~~INCI675.1.p1  ORF type:complete len:510 (+),score=103.86 INCI675.1:70-1599(+)
MSATGAAAPASATAVAAQPKPLIPTKQLSYEERLEALEQKKLEALIKVKESSLAVAKVELSMSKVRVTAMFAREKLGSDPSNATLKQLDSQLEVLRCDHKVKTIEERIARLNEREQRNRVKAVQREKQFGGMNAYLVYLNQRKQLSLGDAHVHGVGWHVYSPTTDLVDAVTGLPVVLPASVPEALVDLTKKMSMALTMYTALSRLGLVKWDNDTAGAAGIGGESVVKSSSSTSSDAKDLQIHVAGADWSEGRSVEATAGMFIELLYLLRGHNIANVNVTLVGPHIDSKLASSSATLPVDGDLPGLSIRYVGKLYHEYAATIVADSSEGLESKQADGEEVPIARHADLPAAVFAFNAGMWGFEEWQPTVQHIVKVMQVPFVVTSYNMHEAFEDEDTLVEWGVAPKTWCWSAELNPFRCLEKRRGNATCNNCYWQCIWSGHDSLAANTTDESKFSSAVDETASVDVPQGIDNATKRAWQRSQFPVQRALSTLQSRAKELSMKGSTSMPDNN